MTLIGARQLGALGLFALDLIVRALRLQLLLPRARRLTLRSATPSTPTAKLPQL